MEKRNATIFYIEPKRVADFGMDMLESPQRFTPKFFAIRLLYAIFKEKSPSPTSVKIMKDYIGKYPELTDEVKKRFPEIFD